KRSRSTTHHQLKLEKLCHGLRNPQRPRVLQPKWELALKPSKYAEPPDKSQLRQRDGTAPAALRLKGFTNG
uniref:hypothetical protein n=1 Tax=Stenotrophomonas maltophilia group sp. Smal12 TaxID=3050414 RepID=UPI00300F20A6